jgi:hypothetical protein
VVRVPTDNASNSIAPLELSRGGFAASWGQVTRIGDPALLMYTGMVERIFGRTEARAMSRITSLMLAAIALQVVRRGLVSP